MVGSRSDGFNAGEILVSEDGVAWRSILRPQTRLNDVKYWRGAFVAIGDQEYVLVSNDGLTWQAASTDRQTGFKALATDGPDALILGLYGLCLISDPSAFRWAPRLQGTNEHFNGVVHAAGRFVAVSQGVDVRTGSWSTPIKVSDDGERWTSWVPPPGAGISLHAISSNQQLTVAVGDNGAVFTSPDLANWSQRESGTSVALYGVASGDGIHVAVGARATILSSTDGMVWTRQSSAVSSTLRTITHGGSGFLAAGDGGVILASVDGRRWTRRNANSTASLQTSAWVEGIGYVLGSRGMASSSGVVEPNSGLLISPDTVTWTFKDLGLTEGIEAIGHSSLGIRIAAGYDGLLLSSRDAANWTRSYHPLEAPLRGFAASASAVVAVGGNGISGVFRLSPPPNSAPGRLGNLSVLTSISTGESFTVGTVVGGSPVGGRVPLLARAVGPSLAQFGVSAVLPNPKLEVFSGTSIVASNSGWGGTSELSAVFSSVGAFAYDSAASKDAASTYSANVMAPPASYTIQVRDVGTGSGAVLAEIYDASSPAPLASPALRLLNLSVMKNLGTSLTAGFVISGGAPLQVLIRAVGPTLGLPPFNVPGAIADPRLVLFDGNSTTVATNDNWGGFAALASAFAKVGAFPLLPDSKDASILVTLAPGSYTLRAEPSPGSTGVVLVEVYEVP